MACIIGLTGGIGCGKTTVTNLFSQYGISIFDADELARELVQPGQETLELIVQRFGVEVLTSEGTLNREKMRTLAFAQAENRVYLESILHPRIYQLLHQRSAEATGPYCIFSVPLLLETGHQQQVSRVLVIDCNEDEQIRRVRQRDHSHRALINQIMNQQVSRTTRLAVAHDVIYNAKGDSHIAIQVHNLHKFYLSLAATPHIKYLLLK